MLYAIELDENGNTTPLTDDRQKAMNAARRKAIKEARQTNDSATVYLLTFNDTQPKGEPNNAERAIGQIVYVGHTTRWGDSAAIDWTDGLTDA